MPLATPNNPAAFRRILNRNVTLPLGVGLLSALLFIAIIAYLMQSQGWVEHSDQVIARAYSSEKADLELETSLRGFLLAGDNRFLDNFDRSMVDVHSEIERLKQLVQDNPEQEQRLGRIEQLQASWNSYARARIAAKHNDPNYQIGAGTGEGKRLKDAVRAEYDEFVALELRLRQQRTQTANSNTWFTVAAFTLFMLITGAVVAWRGRRDLVGLTATYDAAFQEQARQSERLQAQAWLREGQTRLSRRLAAEQDLGRVGHAALETLANYLGSVVGVLYTPETGGGFTRVAGWGLAPGAGQLRERVPEGRSLIAECAATLRPIVLAEVPAGYLQVNSGVGEATARSVVVAPVEHEGRLAAIVELGFLRALGPRDSELLEAVSGIMGASIESARFRQRLQDALDETQQLNEELQVQQEELRTANEELEEQSRALKESQVHLETQQAELEQTNVQLGEQSERLEQQRDQLREAQFALEERASELQRASRYKSEFLANMSHELRTPLNSSLILAKLLADNAHGNLTEEQVKFADSIYNAGNELLTLINDILDIAKVEAGKLEVRAEVTPVASLTGGLQAMFAPLVQRKGLQLHVDVAPDAPSSLFTDRHRLEQILRNLMSNAVKFTEHGSVALRVARVEGDRIAFEVRDSGIGIRQEQHQLVFEAFRQADSSTSRKYGGSGLGLSISRDLARLLGGDIAVVSAPGQGSTFTVTLPLEYQERLAQRPVAMAPPVPSPAVVNRSAAAAPAPTPVSATPSFPDDRAQDAAGRRTVLVVEDDVRFASILFDLAHELGYRCLVAHDAREGLELAMQQVPDAVLLDILLPDETGLAVLQRLKEDPRTRHIPVHALSAEDRSEPALQMGAIGYARKPASREQLHEVFQRLESKLSQKLKRVLLVEDDPRQQESVTALIGDGDVEIVAVAFGEEALKALAASVFDVMIIDLKLPDMTGQELLQRMAAGESRSFPPVIVYTGRNLTRDEETELLRYSRSIIIKGARSPERLLDEVTLFLHRVESQLSTERQKMLRTARSRDKAFEGRRILVVDDDMRNIFALTSALEHKGAEVEVARHGVEALQKLGQNPDGIDLVLMDIMMPEMDGFTATREIRKNPRWQKLPIIAVTAKAMKEDQEKCLAAGANDYLAKPIELERLFSLMRVWMPKLERIL
ncbi:response regulator [Ramlibacter sp.]|uniref:response regulator n=1 Tax=Ramlibacter sp. TaxID=1917967 RepID=UPI00262A41B2|nr:response regulator [Ramlibacter sp.]MDB5957009.1 sensor histidine kinase/response regulator [Ramlibacter sp.]